MRGSKTKVAQQIPITADITEQARPIAAFRPEVLLAYPSNLAALIDLWEAGGQGPTGLRHLKSIGETGRLVVTDLHNLATPMILHAIGD